MKSYSAIVLGPQEINAIGYAIDGLLPWLAESRFRVIDGGGLEFDRPEPVHAIETLRLSVEQVIPEQACAYLGERSGLGWEVFFGHVVGWWLPQRNHLGFLRALVNRAALHDIDLQLHWNRGRVVPAIVSRHGAEPLYMGGGIGAVLAFICSRLWYIETATALLIVGGGLVAGKLYQRTSRLRYCGDPLCRARIESGSICASCGAQTEEQI